MKVYVVGIGPGDRGHMTFEAECALGNSDIIAGYEVYVDLVKEQFPGKQFITTPMKKETDRCRAALDKAKEGCTVSMVCSGDAGIYGMAGLMFELAAGTDIEIEIVPGITAACSGAAVLGAPIGHDFAVISLSDLLTPWEKIEKRLDCAAQADFAICLYNPSSKKRADYLKRACDIILRNQDGKTVAGVVKNIGRKGQECRTMTLAELRETQVDMFTTVFIGNSCTREIEGKMVTPRGYGNG